VVRGLDRRKIKVGGILHDRQRVGRDGGGQLGIAWGGRVGGRAFGDGRRHYGEAWGAPLGALPS
jgi:hypothetical protein